MGSTASNLLQRPWCWLVSQCDIARTRKSMARRLSPIERALDRSHFECVHMLGHTLHVIAGNGSSDRALLMFRSRVLPAAMAQPGRWHFVVQESLWCSVFRGPDQYTVAAHAARRLQIPLGQDPFLPLSSETVIAAAAQHWLPAGATADDLYGALCFEHLPRPTAGDTMEQGLRSGEIHGAVHPRWEALRIRRELHWELEWPHLTDIVTRLLDRLEHDRPGVLDEYEHGLRGMLRDAALGLNEQRLRMRLRMHPARDQVLLLLDEVYLPVVLPGLGKPAS